MTASDQPSANESTIDQSKISRKPHKYNNFETSNISTKQARNEEYKSDMARKDKENAESKLKNSQYQYKNNIGSFDTFRSDSKNQKIKEAGLDTKNASSPPTKSTTPSGTNPDKGGNGHGLIDSGQHGVTGYMPFKDPDDANKKIEEKLGDSGHTEGSIGQTDMKIGREQAINPSQAGGIIREDIEDSSTLQPVAANVSIPQRYADDDAEIVKKIKRAGIELKEIILTGSAVAKEKVKEAREAVEKMQAKRDAEDIAKMGELAGHFSKSFEDILSQASKATYEEQEQIYTGFMKLMDSQHELVNARRDLARRLKAYTSSNPALGSDNYNNNDNDNDNNITSPNYIENTDRKEHKISNK